MTVEDNDAAFQNADMLGIGVHCDVKTCNQLDFLPWRCKCGGVFCLEHRSAHHCRLGDAGDDQVVICPLCARGIKLTKGEDPNIAVDRHSRTDCDPSNYNKVHKKPRCPVSGCREKLATINSFTCKDCGTTVCLKHRLAMDHSCPGRSKSASAAATSRLGMLKNMVWGTSTNTTSPPKAPPATKPATASTRAQQQQTRQKTSTSGNIQSQLQAYRDRHKTNTVSAAATGERPAEVCPQCSARFSTVQELINHASTVHQDGWTSGSIPISPGASSGLERCPHCGLACADAVQLVTHVESCTSNNNRPGSSASDCVLC